MKQLLNKKKKNAILDRKAEVNIRTRDYYESLVVEVRFEYGEARIWGMHVTRNI